MSAPADFPRRSTVRQQLRWAELRAARLERTNDELTAENDRLRRICHKYESILTVIRATIDDEG